LGKSDKMERLVFQAGQRETMLAHVAGCAPEEACGMLAGKGGVVTGIFPVTNILHSQTRFEMEPREQVAVLNLLEESHLELLGIYHSHPLGPVFPSETDIGSFAYPGVTYLIWSYERGTWNAHSYHIAEGAYSEIRMDFPRLSNPTTAQGL
jgi:proteasome lid subunit RPN8/RPN11